jgi:hypothetical protein
MNFDSGIPAHHFKAPDLWRLPKVLSAHARVRHFDPPKRVTTAGVDRQVRDGIEIEIRVSEPFAIRALGPVLWVGEEPLTIAEAVEKTTYRFLSFDPAALKAGAPISLSWNSPGAARQKTEFVYEPPAQ